MSRAPAKLVCVIFSLILLLSACQVDDPQISLSEKISSSSSFSSFSFYSLEEMSSIYYSSEEMSSAESISSDIAEPTQPAPRITPVEHIQLDYAEVKVPEGISAEGKGNFRIVSEPSKVIDLSRISGKVLRISMHLWTDPSYGTVTPDLRLENPSSGHVGYAFVSIRTDEKEYALVLYANADTETGSIYFENDSAGKLPDTTRQLAIVSPRAPLTREEVEDTSDLETFDPGKYIVEGKSPYRMRSECIEPLFEMLGKAEEDGIKNITLRDTYRGYDIQTSMFNAGVNKRLSWGMSYEEAYRETDRRTAFPGTSEHHDGYTIDLVNDGLKLEQNFGNTVFGKWLAANSYKYGYIIRYPEEKESCTTKFYEPWHIRYVGKPTASVIHDHGLVLEELHSWMQEFGFLAGDDFVLIRASDTDSVSIPDKLYSSGDVIISETGDGNVLIQITLDQISSK